MGQFQFGVRPERPWNTCIASQERGNCCHTLSNMTETHVAQYWTLSGYHTQFIVVLYIFKGASVSHDGSHWCTFPFGFEKDVKAPILSPVELG